MIKNFIVNAKDFSVTQEDILQIFGDQYLALSTFDKIIITEAKTMEGLAVLAGIFKSKNRARKNNFQGPIPYGVHCFGTKKNRFWVWNPIKGAKATIVTAFNHTNKMQSS